MSTDPLLVVISGPTAVGKTALTVELAEKWQTEIISCDSRQFYREMSIGTAKPEQEDLERVPHHFIDSHSIEEALSAGQYEQEALPLVDSLFKDKECLILTGGSGLFIDALCHGIAPLPEVPDDIRAEVRRDFETHGIDCLQKELWVKDQEYYRQVDSQNPHRLIRALELIRSTGKKYSELRKIEPEKRPFRVLKICLELPRDELYSRINQRVDLMLEKGLLKEAENLYPQKKLPALKTVGYRELFDFFDNKNSLENAIDLIKRNTRRYAKRQLTWFRRDEAYHWMSPRDPHIKEKIEQLALNRG